MSTSWINSPGSSRICWTASSGQPSSRRSTVPFISLTQPGSMSPLRMVIAAASIRPSLGPEASSPDWTLVTSYPSMA
jgi:hypothetical protein